MFRLPKILLSLLAIVVLLFSLAPVGDVDAGPLGQGNGEKRAYDPETGQLILVSGDAAALRAMVGEIGALSTDQVAETLVNQYATAFGLRNPAEELSLYRAQQFGGEVTTFVHRYQQLYRGVPVFGGNMVVNQQFYGGRVFSYTLAGKFSSGLDLDVTPTLSAEEAVQIARQIASKIHAADAAALNASEASLWIYDERLFTQPAMPAQLVWKVEVSGFGERPFYEVMLINASNGKLTLRYDKWDEGWNRRLQPEKKAKPSASGMAGEGGLDALTGGSPTWEVYGGGNDDNLSNDTLVCSHNAPDCSGYSSASSSIGVNDAQEAKTHLLDTYDFYWNNLGRDSIDGTGMLMEAHVDYRDPYTSNNWYFNARWDGSKMVFGDIMTTDDVTAHEFTHGVTDYTSGLYYIYQSGAINESLSDVFGELIDLSYSHDRWTGSDSTYRWLIGEDIGQPFAWVSAIRSMKNPPAFGDPDSMTSPKYYKGPLDYGGVHTNSGVNNKAAYLMVEGGTFNGKTVLPLGINKVAALYYKVQTAYLFPSANYYDLYNALNAACQAMASVNEAGFNSADCVQVKNATEAVRMHIRPTAITGVTASDCPPGLYYAQPLFSENFESGFGQWSATVNKAGVISPLTPNTAMGIIGSPSNDSLWLSGPAELNDKDSPLLYAEEFVQTSSPISLPAGEKIYLNFTHLYLFETTYSNGKLYTWDGGVVEYSTDGGSTWLDMKPLFNGGVNYNGKILPYASPYWNPNPLAGRLAFVTNSRQTPTRMRYNLTPLAGQSILIRFHTGYDSYTNWGWFIDDVDIHTCTPAPPRPALQAPAQNALIYPSASNVFFNWGDVVPTYLSYYKIQVDDNSDFSSPIVDVNTGTTSEYTLAMASLTPNTKYYWRVASFNAYNQTQGWTAARTFRVAPLPPSGLTPGGGGTIGTLTPTLDWGDVTGAASYTVQISISPTFATLLKNVTVSSSTYTLTTPLPAGKTIYWRVRTNSVNGSSEWATESFVTP
ncbi:MAG: M4 family metallopeptidase [Candidatus Methanomethylicaceae archaeon]